MHLPFRFVVMKRSFPLRGNHIYLTAASVNLIDERPFLLVLLGTLSRAFIYLGVETKPALFSSRKTRKSVAGGVCPSCRNNVIT